jgi:hypothetical protein
MMHSSFIRFFALAYSTVCATSFSFALEQPVASNLVQSPASIEVTTYQKEEIIPLLTLLNDWIEREFSQYPYLYAAPEDRIIFPSDIILVNSKKALVALAKKEGSVVGMAAMISFDVDFLHTTYLDGLFPHLLENVRASGLDPSKMLYVDYFITEPAYHNDEQIVQSLYESIKGFAKSLGKTQVCFIQERGCPYHPACPKKPYHIEPWGEIIQGVQDPGIRSRSSWPTIDQSGNAKETEHSPEFFFIDLDA